MCLRLDHALMPDNWCRITASIWIDMFDMNTGATRVCAPTADKDVEVDFRVIWYNSSPWTLLKVNAFCP